MIKYVPWNGVQPIGQRFAEGSLSDSNTSVYIYRYRLY